MFINDMYVVATNPYVAKNGLDVPCCKTKKN